MPPHPFPLTAGGRHRRTWPVNPRVPPLTTVRDPKFKGAEAQGAICKAEDSVK
jgi:hypothetical protein